MFPKVLAAVLVAAAVAAPAASAKPAHALDKGAKSSPSRRGAPQPSVLLSPYRRGAVSPATVIG